MVITAYVVIMPRIIGINYQVPAGGIADGAITTNKLAATSVTDAKRSYATVTLAGTAIDWSLGDNFYHTSASGPITYTFSNVAEGKIINLVFKNTSGSTITLTFPTTVAPSGFAANCVVNAGASSVFTFVRTNGVTHATVVPNLV